MAVAPAIGIDLGTTYSCVAVFQNGKIEVIANDHGNRTTPSCVAFTEVERLIGEAAKNQAPINPDNTIFDAKRLIGLKFTDDSVQADLEHWPFTVIGDGDGMPRIQTNYKGEPKSYSPEEISSMVLAKMKETAEAYLGMEVRDAVVTVPAYFNDSQRQATVTAGTICGLNILRIINEPTAAALAYGLNKKYLEDRNILIFDFGGGTFDVSVLNISDGIFEVRSTAGNTHLGGEDIDNLMVNHFVEDFLRKHKKDLKTNKKAMRRLRIACEQAKRTLSSSTQACVEIVSLYDGIDFKSYITRARFELLNADLFNSTIDTAAKALKDAKMDKADIHDVVLVGGSTRIPKVQKLLQDFFNGKEVNKNINPDEAVACGAAVQAAMLRGDSCDAVMDMVLVDVTPLSLGIGVKDGLISVIIPRNTSIPTTQKKTFTTTTDNQSTVYIFVYEGERTLQKDNRLLDKFSLEGIPPAPHGIPVFEVTFSINDNGILEVTALDTSTGKNKKVTITNMKGRFNEQEIKAMIDEAKKYRADDEQQRRCIFEKNALERYVFDVTATAEDETLKKKISESEKKNVLDKCKEILSWLENNQLAEEEEFIYQRQTLEQVWNPVVSKLY